MVRIRWMTVNDYDSVYDLWIHTPGMKMNSLDDSRDGIEKYLMRNPKTSFVAEIDDEVAGVIMAGHDGRRGFIYHTAVKLDYRGQGIGKSLVDHAMTALEKEGIHKVALLVRPENAIGNEFWEHLGFSSRDDIVYRNKNIHILEEI